MSWNPEAAVHAWAKAARLHTAGKALGAAAPQPHVCNHVLQAVWVQIHHDGLRIDACRQVAHMAVVDRADLAQRLQAGVQGRHSAGERSARRAVRRSAHGGRTPLQRADHAACRLQQSFDKAECSAGVHGSTHQQATSSSRPCSHQRHQRHTCVTMASGFRLASSSRSTVYSPVPEPACAASSSRTCRGHVRSKEG